MKIILKLLIVIFLSSLFACDEQAPPGKVVRSVQVVEPEKAEEPENVVPVQQEVDQEEQKEEQKQIIEEKEQETIMAKTKLATLFYDNSVVEIDEDFKLKKIKDAESYVRYKNYHAIGNQIYKDDKKFIETVDNVVDFIVYDDAVFYYNGEFVVMVKGKTETTVYVNTYKRQISFTEYGIHDNAITWIDKTGTVYIQEGTSYHGGLNPVKSVNENGSFTKHFHNGAEWVRTTSTPYNTHYDRCHSYKYNGIVYYTRGAIFDTIAGSGKYPKYDMDLRRHTGGITFVKYAQSGANHNMYFIGDDGLDTIFCIDSFDGVLYKYSIINDKLTQWIPLVNGTETLDIFDCNKWFDMLSIIKVGEWFIYFDGKSIRRFNFNTQENLIICEATNLKAWVE